jgi:cytochrome c553
MIWLKRLAYLLGGIVALVILAVGAVYVITALRFRKHYDVPATPVPVAADSATLARGRHLATAIGKCVLCHEADFGGQLMGDSPVFFRLAASNLTGGKGGVASRYNDATLARAIRHGIRSDGRPLYFMPSEAFAPMSDEDVGALVAYIRSLPPVDRELPTPRMGPMARIIYLTSDFPLLPARTIDHAKTAPRSVTPAETAEYGGYLAKIDACTSCHGPCLSGGKLGPDKPAANLTPAGIGSWTEADFVRALREGMRPSGVPIDSTAMPWPLAGRMSDAELHALWLYLRSVPAKPFGNR